MSLRGVWIFLNSGPVKVQEKVIFSRYFTTVEKRSSLIQKKNVKIPPASVICESLIQEFGQRGHVSINTEEEFNSQNDSCSKTQYRPVYEVPLKDGSTLWPVVAIEKFGLIFACLPLVERDLSQEKIPLIEMPGVTIGYKLLHSLVEFVGQWTSREELSSKIKDLQTFLCVAVPFGTPVDTNPVTVQALITGKDIAISQRQKQPSWKPVSHKGKQQILFSIKEEIKASQADLDGIPEITVSILSPAVDYLLVHPSVHEGDTSVQESVLETSQGAILPRATERRIRFRPPAEPFPLCHYSGQAKNGLPIEGIYQMRGDERAVQISLQLKLNGKIKNSFEYFEVHLPFFNRGYIMKFESGGPSYGSLVVGSSKRRLLWSIGQKFPKSLEVVLAGTVFFGDPGATKNQQSAVFIEDPFCQGFNSYVQIFFKLSDFTLTGCSIDPRSLSIYPNSKLSKVNTSIEFITSDYKIWNTFGDAMIANCPPTVEVSDVKQ
ncbi:AP-5 complex subunit mu-1-like isoform X2 [Actinia tenebrosa]|uniref:AP-5 complex subunit mu-1 n=1 Tax=Actinia tenebrosa TaxID=6105 RepID=A0A6P8IMM8_ACTTE|nr:AP-5 complex subunit mu-1-like isoform X2 [Actinia tenebrosa]